eukprot:TRINITY_DN19701_c0_g1_i1.p1 TRINITY_DN19701_c0_g1~~TRINITY_DN19701_c0_g1_i1.p1  ORF type:complete len:258 (+),score=54.76 TRINITY_DN19701_c0_g1_i1:81-854(+)
MRLTADLINRSEAGFNTLRERELNLRGNKIALIENLGATQDAFDVIDLSDNEITKLDNFPLLPRLSTLFVNSNRVSVIGTDLGSCLPQLDTLVLSNNRLANLTDIDPLSALPSLRRLSLLDNLITKKQHYRLYVIHKIPQLKLLDFRKVKPKERQASQKLFGAAQQAATAAATQQPGAAASSAAAASTPAASRPAADDAVMLAAAAAAAPAVPSAAASLTESDRIRQAIASAKSIDEVAALERLLAAGTVPPAGGGF